MYTADDPGERLADPGNTTPQVSAFPLVRQSRGPISQGIAGSAAITNSHLVPRGNKICMPEYEAGSKVEESKQRFFSLVSRALSLHIDTVGLSTSL